MKLKEYIIEKGMTQVAFASLLGISKYHLNKLVNGERTPSFKLLKKIGDISGGCVSFDDFLKKEEL